MTSELSETDIQQQDTNNVHYRRINSNQIMLDLRHQVQHQERVIRSLIAERDSLTRELDSRLFLVEAQLRREQKHIESVLGEKEQLIQFQAIQIQSLKHLLSQVSQSQTHYQRNYHRASKRSLSKRYSVALDEYMKDHCVVSRALPVMVQGENDGETIKHNRCSRARSLPELRFKDIPQYQTPCHELVQNQHMHNDNILTNEQWCHLPIKSLSKHNLNASPQTCCHIPPSDILDEISNRRWTSDCDSEHSDSLDSGISSPSIKSRNLHDNFGSNVPDLFPESEKGKMNGTGRNPSFGDSNSTVHDIFEPEYRNHDAGGQKPRRSSSIGNFINRTFSSSSSPEKIKDNQDTAARRHSSFSAAGTKDVEQEKTSTKTRLINSTNRTFGTNHRSVTKPRDIKFRKLFKFRRRTEPDTVQGEDYMTV